jgi:Fe-S cluster assembly scaffold protein SufB
VDDAAKLGVSVLQESSDEVLALYQAEARVGRDARLLHFEGILGGGFVKNRVEVGLAGSGSDLVLDGLYFTDGETARRSAHRPASSGRACLEPDLLQGRHEGRV